jgi:hypothetical protein
MNCGEGTKFLVNLSSGCWKCDSQPADNTQTPAVSLSMNVVTISTIKAKAIGAALSQGGFLGVWSRTWDPVN